MTLLEVQDLTRHFGGLSAVNHVNFCVNSGEIVGLIGPNGAGKTTVFNLISGILQRAGLNGFKVSSITGKENVGKIFQRLAEQRVNIEFVNQIPLKNGTIDIILCVDNKDAQSTRALLEEVKTILNARIISPLDLVGILSLFPHREHAVISGTITQVLSDADIPLLAMASSISAISCVMKEEQVPKALSLLSRQFSLS